MKLKIRDIEIEVPNGDLTQTISAREQLKKEERCGIACSSCAIGRDVHFEHEGEYVILSSCISLATYIYTGQVGNRINWSTAITDTIFAIDIIEKELEMHMFGTCDLEA